MKFRDFLESLEPKDIQYWTNYASNRTFSSEGEARKWISDALERNDRQFGSVFGVNPAKNKEVVTKMPIYKDGISFKIGKKPKIVQNKKLRDYGGPTLDASRYIEEYQRNQYLKYNQLYDDVQLELSNSSVEIRKMFKCNYQELLWFSDHLNPTLYSSKTLTIESAWEEDFKNKTDYLAELFEWLKGRESTEGVDLSQYDKSKMKCLQELLSDYEWESIGYEWDDWGPHEWFPDSNGEWERCRKIVRDHEEYPITVLFDGSMIDGAHRLAVANYERKRSYPCLVGVPPKILQKR